MIISSSLLFLNFISFSHVLFFLICLLNYKYSSIIIKSYLLLCFRILLNVILLFYNKLLSQKKKLSTMHNQIVLLFICKHKHLVTILILIVD